MNKEYRDAIIYMRDIINNSILANKFGLVSFTKIDESNDDVIDVKSLVDVVITNKTVLKNRHGWIGKIISDEKYCKGSMKFGTGCGECQKCLDELHMRSEKLKHYESINEARLFIDIKDALYTIDAKGYTPQEGWIQAHCAIIELLKDRVGFKFDRKEISKEIYKIEEEKDPKIPVTLGTIKAICDWSQFCEVTGSNVYMLAEHHVEDTKIFYVKKSHAVELGLAR